MKHWSHELRGLHSLAFTKKHQIKSTLSESKSPPTMARDPQVSDASQGSHLKAVKYVYALSQKTAT